MMRRVLIATVALVACFAAVATSASTGLSRYLSTRATAALSLSDANAAISYAPSDPQSHFAKGRVLNSKGTKDLAIASFRRAVELSPNDHRLWLELGAAYQEEGDAVQAVEALTRAVMLAPHYGKPHWELGSALLTVDRKPEALVELRASMESDPRLAYDVVSLVWNVCDGDATKVLEAIQPKDTETQLLLARYFVEQGSIEPAANVLRATGTEGDTERHRLTARLINNGRIKDAFILWTLGSSPSARPLINDGSFQTNLSNRSGFSWQAIRQRGDTLISIDRTKGSGDTSSLSIEFRGTHESGSELVRQLIIIEPDTRYRLSYETVDEGLSKDIAPVVSVVEAGQIRKVLATSPPVARNTQAWRPNHLEFTTSSDSEAVYVEITQKCRSVPCFISGKAWFDNFSLTKF